MKGRVLNYSVQENGGIISGDDGNRYTFVGGQWREQALPVQGSYVDFQVDQGHRPCDKHLPRKRGTA